MPPVHLARRAGRPLTGAPARWAGVGWLLLLAPAAPAQAPVELAPAWAVPSFLEDADLAQRSIYDLAFAGDGTLWVAASDGLVRFDGYTWTRFGTGHGLPSSLVRSVCVTADGRLWVGTDCGAGTFDGGRFLPSAPLAGPSVRRIVEDSRGALWFCCDRWPDGSVTSGLTRLAPDGSRATWGIAEGLPSDYVSDVLEDSSGRQLVATNHGLAQLEPDGRVTRPLQEAGFDEHGYVWSVVESAAHGVLVATDQHLYQRQDGTWRRHALGLPHLLQPKLVAGPDGAVFTFVPQPETRLLRWSGERFVPASEALPPQENAEVLREGPSGELWVAGHHLLRRWDRRAPEWTAWDGLGRPLLRDRRGGIWFADPQGGLLRREPGGGWERIPDASAPVMQDQSGVWGLGADGGVAHWAWGGAQRTGPDAVGLEVSSFAGIDGRDHLWVQGTLPSGAPGLARWDGRTWEVVPLGLMRPGEQILQAHPDPGEGVWCLLRGHLRADYRLLRLGAGSPREVELPAQAQIDHPPQLLVDPGADRLWVFGFCGLLGRARDGDAAWERVPLPGNVVSSARTLGRDLWLSCSAHLGGRAATLWRHDGQWQTLPGPGGLLLDDGAGEELYLASAEGTWVIRARDALEPLPLPLPVPATVGGVVRADGHECWVDAGGQTLRYRPRPEPPETQLRANLGTPHAMDPLVVQVRGVDRFRPSDPRRGFHVSTRLDAGPWTPYRALTGRLELPPAPAGEHVLEVRVRSGRGLEDPSPARLRFEVLPIPLQRRSWFAPVLLAVSAALLGLTALSVAFLRRLRHQARALEDTVERRTRELATSERTYRTLFQESLDAICLFDADGALIECNDAARQLLGDAAAGRASRLAALFVDEGAGGDVLRAIAEGGSVSGARVRVRGREGPLDVLLTANRHRSGGASPEALQVILHDVTRQTQLEERVRQSRKMEALGRMAGGVAHDFNNILTVIQGYTQLLCERLSDQEARQDLDVVLDSTARAKALTQQIQTFGRSMAPAGRVMELRPVLDRAVELAQRVLPERVALTLQLAPDLGRVRLDPSQLEQALVNLVLNAAQSIPEEGRVTLRARREELDATGAAELGLAHAGGYARLEVEDTGVGMDVETLQRIFDPFFTTKPTGQGTGLGLAIVYGVVQQLGGSIRADSAPGQGSRFTLLLPRTASAPEAEEEPPDGQQHPTGSETVLVAEDEAPIRDLMQRMLQAWGYTVLVAADGDEALALLEAREGRVDLIVSDVVMPHRSGLELLRAARARWPDLPALLTSGHPQSEAGDGVLADGATPLLKKPFPAGELARRVRELLDGGVGVGPRVAR